MRTPLVGGSKMNTPNAKRRLVFSIALSLGLLCAGLAAGIALADSPTDTQYGNAGTTEPTTVTTTTATTTTETTSTETTSTDTTSTDTTTTDTTTTVTEPTKAVKPAQGGESGGSEPQSSSDTPAPTVTKSSQDLPFTGQNIALFVGLGGLLLFGGYALRRAGRKDDTG